MGVRLCLLCPGLSPSPPPLPLGYEAALWAVGGQALPPFVPDSPPPPPLPLGYEAHFGPLGVRLCFLLSRTLGRWGSGSPPPLSPLHLGYKAALWAVGGQALPPFVPDSQPPLPPSPSATRQHFGPLGVRLCLLLSRTLPLSPPPPPRLRGSTLGRWGSGSASFCPGLSPSPPLGYEAALWAVGGQALPPFVPDSPPLPPPPPSATRQHFGPLGVRLCLLLSRTLPLLSPPPLPLGYEATLWAVGGQALPPFVPDSPPPLRSSPRLGGSTSGRWGSGSASFCPGISPSPHPLPLGYEAALWAVGGQALPPFVPDSPPPLPPSPSATRHTLGRWGSGSASFCPGLSPSPPPLPLGYEAALWAVGGQALPPFVPASLPPLPPSPSATRQHFGPLGVRLCLLLSRTLSVPCPPPPRLRGSTLGRWGSGSASFCPGLSPSPPPSPSATRQNFGPLGVRLCLLLSRTLPLPSPPPPRLRGGNVGRWGSGSTSFCPGLSPSPPPLLLGYEAALWAVGGQALPPFVPDSPPSPPPPPPRLQGSTLGRWGSSSASFCPGLSASPPLLPLGYEAALWDVGGQALPPFVPDCPPLPPPPPRLRGSTLGRWGSGSASFCPGSQPPPPLLPVGHEAALRWGSGSASFCPGPPPLPHPLPLGYEAALWAVGGQALPPFVPDSPPPLPPSPSATRQHFGPLGVRLCLLLSRTLPLPSPPPPRLRGRTLGRWGSGSASFCPGLSPSPPPSPSATRQHFGPLGVRLCLLLSRTLPLPSPPPPRLRGSTLGRWGSGSASFCPGLSRSPSPLPLGYEAALWAVGGQALPPFVPDSPPPLPPCCLG